MLTGARVSYWAKLSRFCAIARVMLRYDLDEWLGAMPALRFYYVSARLLPWRWWRKNKSPRAQRLRLALIELGPIFVKFGQILSTRPDLLPADIATELTLLQDRVPPFASAEARRAIEHALEQPIEQCFTTFDEQAIASASVAQVHRARLQDGTAVAVKVLRPGIEKMIVRDLAVLDMLAKRALHRTPDLKRLRPIEVVDEFRKHLEQELDLRTEAANASQLRANMGDWDAIYVPKVYWEHTRRNVMTLEWVEGIRVDRIDELRAAGIDLRQLAHNGVKIFFTQAFRDGFFHADMHPGNIMVSKAGRYCAVDFGIMGSLGERDKRYLAENFLAFFHRDYRAVAEAHLRAQWVPPGTRADEFESAIRTVCEPIFAKPIKDISFGRLLLQLFQTARRFNMEVQPQLVLLQKTLFNIEGLGRQLYPDLDLWETAKPFLEDWSRAHLGPRALLRTLKQELPKWWEQLPELPRLLHKVLTEAAQPASTAAIAEEIKKLRYELVRQQRRFRWWLFGLSGTLALVAVALAMR